MEESHIETYDTLVLKKEKIEMEIKDIDTQLQKKEVDGSTVDEEDELDAFMNQINNKLENEKMQKLKVLKESLLKV